MKRQLLLTVAGILALANQVQSTFIVDIAYAIFPSNNDFLMDTVMPMIETFDTNFAVAFYGFTNVDLDMPFYPISDGWPALIEQIPVGIKWLQTGSTSVGRIFRDNFVPQFIATNPLYFGKGFLAAAYALRAFWPAELSSLLVVGGQDLSWIPLAVLGPAHVGLDIAGFAVGFEEFVYNIDEPSVWTVYIVQVIHAAILGFGVF